MLRTFFFYTKTLKKNKNLWSGWSDYVIWLGGWAAPLKVTSEGSNPQNARSYLISAMVESKRFLSWIYMPWLAAEPFWLIWHIHYYHAFCKWVHAKVSLSPVRFGWRPERVTQHVCDGLSVLPWIIDKRDQIPARFQPTAAMYVKRQRERERACEEGGGKREQANGNVADNAKLDWPRRKTPATRFRALRPSNRDASESVYWINALNKMKTGSETIQENLNKIYLKITS